MSKALLKMSGEKLDVDKYRTEFECDEHWALRRRFLVAHRDKFPEDELVCLAQTFTNIEFLGCRYPEKTMKKVALLAQGIVDEYREKQKGRLQRTFVAASDAAGAKVKGLKRPQTDATPSPVPEKQPRVVEDQHLPVVVDLTGNVSPVKARVLYGPSIHSLVSEKVPRPSSRYGGVRTYHIRNEPVVSKVELKSGPYGKLVLVENDEQTPFTTIERSAILCNIDHSFRTERLGDKVRVKLYVNNVLVSQCDDFTAKAAKDGAAFLGLQKLKESCYTIKVKVKFSSETVVDKSMQQGQGQEQNHSADVDTPLSDENVGSKLLRLMGWTGGGLGRNAQGIAEPIAVQQEMVRRAGFGMGGAALSNAQFSKLARGLLEDYANRDTGHDLVFTSEFSIHERRVLHQLAHKLRLKTRSYGKNEDRHLVVSKKISFWDEANKLLMSGGTSDKYHLIPPEITL